MSTSDSSNCYQSFNFLEALDKKLLKTEKYVTMKRNFIEFQNWSSKHKPWKFQVVQRTWEPENSKIHLKVRLDNPQEFLDLSEEKKDTLKYRLEQEPYNKRPRRPPMSLERVHVVLTSEQQEIQDQDLRNLPCEPLQVGARHALPLQRWCAKVENA
jgi:hypothetical protein